MYVARVLRLCAHTDHKQRRGTWWIVSWWHWRLVRRMCSFQPVSTCALFRQTMSLSADCSVQTDNINITSDKILNVKNHQIQYFIRDGLTLYSFLHGRVCLRWRPRDTLIVWNRDVQSRWSSKRNECWHHYRQTRHYAVAHALCRAQARPPLLHEAPWQQDEQFSLSKKTISMHKTLSMRYAISNWKQTHAAEFTSNRTASPTFNVDF